MPPSTDPVQKLCPSCSTLAYTSERRCPWCGAGYRRRRWGGLIALLLVQTALILGGMAYMLTVAGDELDRRLDDRVGEVERDLDDSFDEVEQAVRDELDRRLPAESSP
jgi:RNA polymerase subunit RPABC4/transcription elongation factor Spt4